MHLVVFAVGQHIIHANAVAETAHHHHMTHAHVIFGELQKIHLLVRDSSKLMHVVYIYICIDIDIYEIEYTRR